jgi:hypothetical protein
MKSYSNICNSANFRKIHLPPERTVILHIN